MNLMFYQLKRHWPAAAVAAVFGLLAIWPTIASINNIGWQNFRGVYPVFSDDETHYLAMAKDLLEGHDRLGNAFYFEHKDEAELMSSWQGRLLAGEANIFALSLPAVFAVNDFLLVFLGLISLYAFLLLVCRNQRLWALAGAGLYYLLFIYSFNRPVIPQFGMVVFFWGLGALWLAYDAEFRRTKLVFSAISGLLAGLLVNIYPFYWTALAAVFGLMALRHLKLYGLRSNFFVLLIGFIPPFSLFVVAYGAGISAAAGLPAYGETVARLGMISGHWPGSYASVGLSALALLSLMLGWKKLDHSSRDFSAILLLAAVSLNWSNVITGKYLQFSSHYWMVTALFLLICFIISVPQLAASIVSMIKQQQWRQSAALKVVLAIILMFSAFAPVIWRQKHDLAKGWSIIGGAPEAEMSRLQSYRPVFNWLNANTQPDSVVLSSDPSLSDLLPIYSHNNLYYYGYGGAYLLSDREMEYRWIVQKIIAGIDPDRAVIENEHRNLWFNGLIDRYQNAVMRRKLFGLVGIGMGEPQLYDDRVERVLAVWQELKKLPLGEALSAYRVDYYIDRCIGSRGFGARLHQAGEWCVYGR